MPTPTTADTPTSAEVAQHTPQDMRAPKQVRVDRLRRNAANLRALPPRTRRFNLGAWRETDSCGTTCCAVGWDCLNPASQAEGFSIDSYAPIFGPWRNWEAVCAFYGLTLKQAHHLFLAYSYAAAEGTRPHTVAARIEAFCDAQVAS